MTELRRLIVNADDLGIAEGVDRGILEAHTAGVVTAASLLANGASFAHAVRLARAAPALSIGVHLDFVAGRPLTKARSLVDARSGRFHSLARLACLAALGRVAEDDVIGETSAQIARVRDAGVQVTHVDSHRHAHLIPGIWTGVATATEAAQCGPLRIPVERLTLRHGRVSAGATLKIAALRAAAAIATRGRMLPVHSDHFAGLALQGRRDFAARLLALLDGLPLGTTELMVHPGRVDAELSGADPYTAPRETELAALLSGPIRERVRRGDFRLVGFGEVSHH